MRKHKYNHDLIYQLITDGKSAKEIRKQTGIPVGIIHYAFKKLGLKPLIKDNKTELKIISLYKKGFKTTEISEKLKINISTIHYYLKKNNLKTPKNGENIRKYHYNLDIFNKIDTEEKAYWLGFLYADGYNNEKKGVIRLLLSKKDENHLLKFQNFIEGNPPIKYEFGKSPSSDNITEHCYINIASRQISNDLKNQGCGQNKSLILKFPTPEQVPNELLRHFIRGYFDGDGSVFISNEKHHRSRKIDPVIHCRITGTKSFLEGVLKEVNIGNEECIIKIGKIYDYRIKREPRCKALFDYLYKNSNIYLKRKKKIFDQYFKKDVQRL